MAEPHLVPPTRPDWPEHDAIPWDMRLLDARLPALLASRGLEALPVRIDTSTGILARAKGYDVRVIVDREELAIARELGWEELNAYVCRMASHLYELCDAVSSARLNGCV